MYLFTRSGRFGPGSIRDAMSFSVEVTEKVRQETSLDLHTWQATMSPQLGTITWAAFVDSLEELEAAQDKLAVSDAFMDLAEKGGKLFAGPLTDGLASVVHGEPAPDRPLPGVRQLGPSGRRQRAARRCHRSRDRDRRGQHPDHRHPDDVPRGVHGPVRRLPLVQRLRGHRRARRAETALAADEQWVALIDRVGTAYLDGRVANDLPPHRLSKRAARPGCHRAVGSAPVEPGHDLDVGGVREQVDQLAARRGRSPASPRSRASRPRAPGSQLTSTTRPAWVAATLATASAPSPVRGGSATTTSAWAAPQWSTSARTTRASQAGEVHPGVGRPTTPTARRASPAPSRRERAGEQADAAVEVDEVAAGGQRTVDRARAPRRRAPRRRRRGPGRTSGPRSASGGRPAPRGTTPGARPTARPPTRPARRRAPSPTSGSTLTMTRRSPVPAPARSTTSPSGKRPSTTSSSTSGWATRHGPMSTTSWLLPAPEPEPPAGGHAAQGGAVAGRRAGPGPRRPRRRGGPGGAARRPPPRP